MSDWADRSSDDLGARIVSGTVLVAVGLGSVWAGGAWLAAAAAAAATAMSFEWARMSERPKLVPAFLALWLAAVAAVMAASHGRFDLALAALAAGAIATALRPLPLVKRCEAAFGVFYVGAPCAAFVWLRGGEDGLAIAIALFAVIWSADIFAYAGGRLLGGPRIAPSLSPNKTWAGLAAGTLAGAVAGYGLAIAAEAPPPGFVALGAGLAAIGLAGDLFESLVKRRFGVKDASNLIPGHGGALDRLDGLMAATLAAAGALAAWPQAPDLLLGARP